jgi:uncharacterized membrane protein YfcA
MMDYLVVCITAFVVSCLTLFSGFGLGTVLLPVFAIFFPVEEAVAMTAVVHLLNNLFKLALVGRMANLAVVMRFGIPAIVAAMVGAWLLVQLSDLPAVARYEWAGTTKQITPVKLAVAGLMILFAFLELWPRMDRLRLSPRWLPVGGLVSGFFGGLSGHQGALRSAFLLRAGLSKEAFIGTGVVIACLVDVSRLGVYAAGFSTAALREHGWLIAAAAAAAALAGALLGRRLLPSITHRQIRLLVAVLLIGIAVGLGSGLI